jgi:hypothetical protein
MTNNFKTHVEESGYFEGIVDWNTVLELFPDELPGEEGCSECNGSLMVYDEIDVGDTFVRVPRWCECAR